MTNRPTVTQLPKETWDQLLSNVARLDARVTAIERAQRAQRNLLAAAIAIIPVATTALVTIIEAIKA